ncbi:MAG: hypothetical protein HDKAJFGB_03315 [Anaerolineae bacterium]|nr:hypothetical protein [Anaerolineae bacterium]RIK33729.1 MAG: hypothetical protein DCC52_02525 [Chloroflexota bacterium]
MANDSFFALMCASLIALFFGFVLAFSGYRFFLVILPIWGFFWGFGLGAQTIQAIFGTAFLSDVTSWLVGFVVGVVFAVLSYLFYIAAVALLGASLGYALGTGIMLAIFPSLNILTWIVGIVVAVIFAIGVLALNLQKWIILLATAVLGAAIIVGTFLFMFGGLPSAQLVANPVRVVLQTSPFWAIVFLALAAFGVVAQYQSTRRWELVTYNRWEEMNQPA